MKQIIFLIFLIFASISNAFEYSSFHVGSSISVHPMATFNDSTDKFSNKLSNDGMFVSNNPTIDWSHIKVEKGKYKKFTLIYSRDCVDSPVYGFAYSYGTYHSKYLYTGLAVGAYFMSDKVWKEREISPSWISIHNKFTGPHTAFVPVIGGEVNVKLLKVGNVEINWSNYINPFLINSTVGIGFTFK